MPIVLTGGFLARWHPLSSVNAARSGQIILSKLIKSRKMRLCGIPFQSKRFNKNNGVMESDVEFVI